MDPINKSKSTHSSLDCLRLTEKIRIFDLIQTNEIRLTQIIGLTKHVKFKVYVISNTLNLHYGNQCLC